MEQNKAKIKIRTGFLNDVLKGHKAYLLIAIAFLVLAVVFTYLVPLVTSFTVDYVIGTQSASELPDMLGERFTPDMRDYLRSHLYVCALALLLFALGSAVTGYFRRHFTAFASEGIAKKMRDRLYTHLQNVPYDYYKHVSTGDLVQRCTSDVDTIRRFISVQLLEIFRTIAIVVFACIIMFRLNTTMSFVCVSLLPILLISSFVYFTFVQKHFTISDEAEGALSAFIQENLTGVRVVRAFGQQRTEFDKFTHLNADFRDKTYKLIRLLGIYWGMSDTLGFTQIALSLFVGTYLCVKGSLTLGELLVFTSYTTLMTWPVRQLGRVLADLGKAKVSLSRLDEIMANPAEPETGAALTPPIHGTVEFKHVCFGYDSFDDVLSDISFTAQPGQTVAILGSTGSGKTSLVQLLQRLYTVTRGEILIDGVNINEIDHGHLRKNIGIVLQEPFLYSRSIMENIKIVAPDASDEDVFEATRTAAVHDVIESFEKGYDTVVGERGVTLSGGQKQRVAIARTLMQKAPILIFDDSMSAVDTETDAAIRESLRKRKHDSTTFIISHRITTLSTADKILVLENGKLVQQGTHDELLKSDGLYRRIADIQNSLEDELKGASEEVNG